MPTSTAHNMVVAPSPLTSIQKRRQTSLPTCSQKSLMHKIQPNIDCSNIGQRPLQILTSAFELAFKSLSRFRGRLKTKWKCKFKANGTEGPIRWAVRLGGYEWEAFASSYRLLVKSHGFVRTFCLFLQPVWGSLCGHSFNKAENKTWQGGQVAGSVVSYASLVPQSLQTNLSLLFCWPVSPWTELFCSRGRNSLIPSISISVRSCSSSNSSNSSNSTTLPPWHPYQVILQRWLKCTSFMKKSFSLSNIVFNVCVFYLLAASSSFYPLKWTVGHLLQLIF